VYIAGHIPPIVDSYGGQPQWNLQYVVKYKALVQEYSDIIKAQLFGHVHSMEFRYNLFFYLYLNSLFSNLHAYRVPMHYENADGVPIFSSGAISPLFGNNPSFTIWEYDQTTFELQDFTVYATNLSQSEVYLSIYIYAAKF